MNTSKEKSLHKDLSSTRMNQDNQGIDPDAVLSGPVKRKRGRPRKNPVPNGSNANVAFVSNDGNTSVASTCLNHDYMGNVRFPPEFEGKIENQPRHAGSRSDPQDVKVGQAVTGVIAAEFDAGYLLTVRIGNSNTTLGGVVFKPGNYIPVSADNDVTPKAPMIHRETHELHCSSVSNAGSRLGAAKGKHEALARGDQAGLRCKEVPVQGRESVAYQQSFVSSPPHLMATRVKQTSDRSVSSNWTAQAESGLTFGDQMILTKAQANGQTMPKGIHCESGPCSQRSARLLQEAESKSMRLPGKSLKLLTDGNSSVEGSDHKLEYKPFLAGSSQAVRPDCSTTVFKLPEKYRTTRMTELLQVVQENTRVIEATLAEEVACVSKNSGV